MTRRGAFALAAMLLASVAVRAQILPAERPFVEHRLVLQISDDSEAKQHLLLNNAENVMKMFGPDKVAIEVVAFGPGIGLLRADNPNAGHIRSLVMQGVRFDACQNTIDAIERTTGTPFPLNPQAERVPSGLAQIITLVEHGYTLVRP
jgi:intracellular sulfur oxidation DsrE/DsrF family protein